MEGDDILAGAGYIEPSTPFGQGMSERLSQTVLSIAGFCSHLDPHEMHVKYHETETPDFHVCRIKKERGLEDTACAFSTEGMWESAYDYRNARKCPMYTTDDKEAERMRESAKSFPAEQKTATE